jgi:hypothetical protein
MATIPPPDAITADLAAEPKLAWETPRLIAVEAYFTQHMDGPSADDTNSPASGNTTS